MARNHVVLLEDDPDLAMLVGDLLAEANYEVQHVTAVEQLLQQCASLSPCVALVDSLTPTGFDLWWVGPKLAAMGVPPVAFTAHHSALREFSQDPHEFVGVISKPFDAEEFLEVVNSICWEDHHRAAS